MKAYSVPNIAPGLVIKSWLKHGSFLQGTDNPVGEMAMIISKSEDTEALHRQRTEESISIKLFAQEASWKTSRTGLTRGKRSLITQRDQKIFEAEELHVLSPRHVKQQDSFREPNYINLDGSESTYVRALGKWRWGWKGRDSW